MIKDEAWMRGQLEGTFHSLEGNRRPKYQAERKKRPEVAQLTAIIDAAAHVCRSTPQEIRSKSRSLRCLMACQVITYIARTKFEISYREIASAIGKDHSTLLKRTLPEAVYNLEMIETQISRTIAHMEKPA